MRGCFRELDSWREPLTPTLSPQERGEGEETPPEAVIASEAKQSMSPSKERMDCFVAALLAMTM